MERVCGRGTTPWQTLTPLHSQHSLRINTPGPVDALVHDPCCSNLTVIWGDDLRDMPLLRLFDAHCHLQVMGAADIELYSIVSIAICGE